jgi:hypothetical protein
VTTPPDPELTSAAEAALARVVEDWLARPGVVSVEVGRRWRDDAPTDDISIRVTVERVLPLDEVPDGELFPRSLEGFPVDVVEGRPPQLERP